MKQFRMDAIFLRFYNENNTNFFIWVNGNLYNLSYRVNFEISDLGYNLID